MTAEKWVVRGKGRGASTPRVWHTDRTCPLRFGHREGQDRRETKLVTDEQVALRGLRACGRCSA